MEETEADFDPDFLRHMYPKLDWAALKGAAETLGEAATLWDEKPVTLLNYCEKRIGNTAGVSGLPDSVTEEMLANDYEFLQLFHHALLEVTLEEGALICPETGRRFPVKKGIPNMLLREDEC